MPTVLLTRYECDRNLVPKLCTRCGAPTGDAVRLTVLTPVPHVLVAALLTLCPPAFIVAAKVLQRRRAMKLPMCPADRADWQWRDRVTSWSYVFAVLVPYIAAIGVVFASVWFEWEGGNAIGLMGYLVTWTCWVAPTALIWTRTVRTTRVAGEGIRLSGVCAEFVAALQADRAADPDPARRAWFGDIRDDYDDGPG